MNDVPTILAVFAHPDDESYGPAGTLALYAKAGVAVHLVIFTNGEAGSIGVSKTLSAEELGSRRKVEMENAGRAIGVTSLTMIGLPDSRLHEVDLDEGTAIVRRAIDRHRPEILMTFHERGVSGHPDHIAVFRFCEKAFGETGDHHPLKLYGWAIPESFRGRFQSRREIQLVSDDEINAIIEIPESAVDSKIEAIEAHETQIEFYHQLQEWFGDYRKASSQEFFHLARTKLAVPTGIMTDLFLDIPGFENGMLSRSDKG